MPLKSIKSLPTIHYEPSPHTTPDVMRQEGHELYCKHKDHESGFMKSQNPFMPTPVLVPTQISSLKAMFEIDAKGFVYHEWPESFQAMLGTSVITLNGKQHSDIRKILNPLFLRDEALKKRFEVINNCTKQLIDRFCVKTTDNEYVHVWHEAKQWAFDIILGVMFGHDILNKDKTDKIMDHFTNWSAGLMDTNINNLNKPDTILGNAMIHRRLILQELETLIIESVAKYNSKTLDTKCTLYKLLDTVQIIQNEQNLNGDDKALKMTVSELADNILILINAGHDTTASSCSNVVYSLDQFQENEMIQILQSDFRMNEYKLNDYDYIMNHKELDYFVKEVMRYSGVVPGLGSRVLTKDCVVNNYEIEKGNKIFFDIYNTAKNEEIFERPMEFNPLRFENDAGREKYWFPFGLGRKKCLGWKMANLELKLFTAIFCTQCKFELDPERLNKAFSAFSFFDVYGKFYALV
eukprot:349852_1